MPSTMPAPQLQVRQPTSLPWNLAPELQQREVDSWLGRTFTGPADAPLTVVFDLDPLPQEPGVAYLVELVKGVGRELSQRNQGRVVLVFATSREPVREAVRSLARTNDIPIYIAASSADIERAEPALPMTPGKRITLEAVAASGRATATTVATRTGASPVAAGNTLAELFTQGLLLRHEGSGRVAHTYEHPAAGKASRVAATTVAIPESLSVEIAEIANMAGRHPEDLISQAWREFMATNAKTMAGRYEIVAGQIRSGDRDGLLESLTRDSSERAAATRPAKPKG